VKKRKRLLHEEGNEAQKQQHEAVGGRRASGDSVKKKHEKDPNNCQSRQCEAGRASASTTVEEVCSYGKILPCFL
jgi:hypothetical protein